jgi:hypothetical protein
MLLACYATNAASSDLGASQLQSIVVTATAIPGTPSIEADKIPGNVQILSSADLTREGLGQS